jgi:hypothetical protein
MKKKVSTLGDIALITPFIPLILRGIKKSRGLTFERVLAGKTELLRP